ncbi:hypothetical protein A1O1_00022 [Capronia coronata CBS 617.96]|uniref:DUF7492 domain-containing protein n=1 Tax=Capronia coronata CBS 617.96 TaxID=1182541 RepID=W9ZK88_9EURO|nr:uncharacterized protein A1O1_00022 [Capronia coronata CBS 617.96]EXJ94904.1 hypothetical protein A1O1_00022 [Capronia coronata CBS 617.96]
MHSTKSLMRNALFAVLAATPFTTAHTWIEQLMVIAPNGTLVGEPGFPRGNVLRGTPGFGDPAMVNLIPPDGRPINQIQSTDLMCKSTQTSQTQTDGSPRLQAAPGSAVALRFQENGHVTLPDNQPGKPSNRGTVYVYGTTQPSPDDSFLAIHRVWNAQGTGGDGRGVLLSTQNFDDGQCYQVNGGPISQQRQQQFKHAFDTVMGSDLWCQQDIQLPSNAPSGKPYTLYWVWDWPTMPGTSGFPNGKQEIYTTCMDVDIVDDAGIGAVSNAQAQFIQGQPVDYAAIATEFSDIANPTAVTGQSIPFSGVSVSVTSKSVPTKSTQPLTFSTGSTIAFSASATGPVSGGASEASVVAAISTGTGVPAFLTVHTGSTAGPGIETQSFSVIPIGVSTTDAQPAQQTDNFGQGRGGNNNGESGLESSLSSVLSLLNSLGDHQGPQVTAAPNAEAAVATFTEYESITETVYQTVYSTRYTKRDGKPTPPMFASAPGAFPSRSALLRSMQPTFAPGEPHSVFRGGDCSHTCGRGNGTSHGKPRPGLGHGRNGDGNPWFESMRSETVPTPTTAGSITMMHSTTDSSGMPGSIMTMPDGYVMTMPAGAPFPPLDMTAESPSITVSSATSIDSESPSLASTSTQIFGTISLTVVPIPDSAPEPTVAPVIAARAADPNPADENCSTAHPIFRLRARNPFIWLGWTTSLSEPKATATL